jgi:glycosidase
MRILAHHQVVGLLLCYIASPTSSSVAKEHVCLAGSFNNWSATDESFRMKPTGDRLEFVKYWPCGVHQFKFAFDGSWGKHLGSAGGDRLEQPGANIPLTIKQSGVYAIWLDTRNSRWGIDPREPDKPYARIRVIEFFSEAIGLDASLSLPRAGHPLSNLTWEVRALDARAATTKQVFDKATIDSPTWDKIDRPGQYRIRLTISDGEMSDEAEITQRLGYGFAMDVRPSEHANRVAHEIMLPMLSGRWCAPTTLQSEANALFSVRRIGSSDTGHSQVTRASHMDPGRQYWVLYDERLKQLDIRPEGIAGFSYDPSQDSRLERSMRIETVDIVGSFTGWQPGVLPMHLIENAPRFTRYVELPDGTHHYKLLVNGHLWLEDLKADSKLRVPDGTGGYNSGIRIGPDSASFGAVKDDYVECRAIRHDPRRSEDFATISKNLAKLTARTLHNDARAVSIRVKGRNDAIPMRLMATDSDYDHWSANCSVPQSDLKYAIEVSDGPSRVVIDLSGCRADASPSAGARESDANPFVAGMNMTFETPDWAKRVVWYQVFPERFCNGDASNDPPRTVPWTHEWYKPYKAKTSKKLKDDERRRGAKDSFSESEGFFNHIFDRRYGGDLQGVRQRLPYLKNLGITAIYLNPIFLAESMHKYDASDYRHIDDFFGVAGSMERIRGETTDPATWQWSESDRVFLDFLKDAHQMGFKVIIDGVFNHVGRDFWAFKDVLKHGKKSRYADWFDITSWKPFHYKAWDKNDGALPRLKHDDALGLVEPVREHLFAVTRRWMDPDGDGDPSDGIDGWRLDVAGDINANFWRDWRKLVKKINPNAYIVAELWQESRQWLDGETFDAVMNYPFAVSWQRFLVNKKKKISASEFQKQLSDILNWYPPQVNYVLQNLFDSHDTDRAASMFMNPDLEYDQANRQQDNGPKYKPGRPTKTCYEKLKLSVTLQMTFLGAPMIYYGDEVGMYGADDPSCRKPMLWADLMPYDDPDERIIPDVLEHYRRMIALRNTYPALQLGTFEPLLANDSAGVFAYTRRLDGQEIVVVLNGSDATHNLDVPVAWTDGTMVIRLDDPESCSIVAPTESDASARPLARAELNHKSSLRVERGRLRGAKLKPWSGAVIMKAS